MALLVQFPQQVIASKGQPLGSSLWSMLGRFLCYGALQFGCIPERDHMLKNCPSTSYRETVNPPKKLTRLIYCFSMLAPTCFPGNPNIYRAERDSAILSPIAQALNPVDPVKQVRYWAEFRGLGKQMFENVGAQILNTKPSPERGDP